MAYSTLPWPGWRIEMNNWAIKTIYSVVGGLVTVTRNTESIGLELSTLAYTGGWWAVILGPWQTPLLDRLLLAAPEWFWGAALSFAFFAHFALILGWYAGQRPYWNLRLRNAVCLYDVGLWLYITWAGIEAHVPFAVATAIPTVLVAFFAGISLCLKILHTRRVARG